MPGISGFVFLVVSPEINVDHVTANANQTLGFIRHNIKTKMSKDVKRLIIPF